MSKEAIEQKLPKYLLKLASLRGNEYAWPLEVIPDVIASAKNAGLLNVGGQLQFRLDKGTCEAYWVLVDVYKSLPDNIDWETKVQLAADIALHDFKKLSEKWSYMEIGREWALSCPDLFPLEDESIKNAMCFVWDCLDKEE